jgi:hypothetical protein
MNRIVRGVISIGESIISIFIRKKELKYPADFALIDFSPIALQRGLKGNRNKLIYRHFINRFGNMDLKILRYSEERVSSLRVIHKIPIYDKTQKEARFPVFAKILPGEASYLVNR